MFSTDLKIIRYTPDAEGKGGSKTGFSRFTPVPINDAISSEAAFVFLGAWKRESQQAAIPAVLAPGYATAAGDWVTPVALHAFSRYSLTDVTVAPTIEILSCNYRRYVTSPSTFSFQVWNFSTASTPGNHVVRTSSVNAQTARFLTINNRCLIGDGGSEAQWYTGADLRAVSNTGADSAGRVKIVVSGTGFYTGQQITVVGVGGTVEANGTWTIEVLGVSGTDSLLVLRDTTYANAYTTGGTAYLQNVYSFGIGQPVAAPQLAYSGTVRSPYYSHHDSTFAASPDATGAMNLLATGDSVTLFLPTPPGGKAVKVLSSKSSDTTKSLIPGFAAGAFPMSNWGPITFPLHGGVRQVSSYIVYAQPGSPTVGVYGAIGTNRGTNAYELVGAKFYAKIDASPQSDSVEWELSGTILNAVESSPNTVLTLDTVATGYVHMAVDDDSEQNVYPYTFELRGTRIGLAAGTPFSGVDDPPKTNDWPQNMDAATGGLVWSGVGPMYAYAWYDPVTGHMSNISPVTQVDHSSGVNVSISVGQWDLSYPGELDRGRFTHIVFFRSLLAGGSSLFVVGGLDPADASTWRGISSNFLLNYKHVDLANPGTQSHAGICQVITSTAHDLLDGDKVAIWGLDGGNAFMSTIFVDVIDDTHFDCYWDAGLLNPIGYTADPATSGTVAWTYWRDANPDSALLVNGVFRAPIFTNNKPRIIQNGVTTNLFPKELAYWDGRVWVVGTQEPSAIHYSCDSIQCPLGRPEESFPDTNVIRIPADDGQVVGLKLFGESLLITTERWTYTIVGNNETNYRLMRVSTRMAGVGTYQMAEVSSQAEGGNSTMIFLGQDKRLYAMPMGAEPQWISRDVQDQIDLQFSSMPFDDFNARQSYQFSKVHVFNCNGRRGVLFASVGAPATIMIYDFDAKVWTTTHVKYDANYYANPLAFVSAYGQNPSPIELVAYRGVIGATQYGIVTKWLDPAVAASPSISSSVMTFPSGFDGQKIRKQLMFVRIFVDKATSPGHTWTCTVRVDYNTSYTVTFVTQEDATFPWVKGTSDGIYELIAPTASFNAVTGAPLVGYVFEVKVTFPADTLVETLYAIDVGYQPIAGQIDP